MKPEPTSIGLYRESVLSKIHLLVPGVERIDFLFYNPDKNRLQLTILARDEYSSTFADSLNTIQIEKAELLRSVKTSIAWLTLNEIPHLLGLPNPTESGNLESEHEKVVLLARLRNEYDGKYDLIFLWEIRNLSVFGLSSKGELTAGQKDLVARLMFNSIRAMIDFSKETENLLRKFKVLINSNELRINEIREKNSDITTGYQNQVVDLCKYYLSKAGMKFKKNFYFSDGVIDQLRTYTGALSVLEDIIEKAVDDVIILDTGGYDIAITESFINFNIKHANYRQIAEYEEHDCRQEMIFLDELEVAALRTVEKGDDVIGKNLVKNLDRGRSFAALSSYINHHERQIKKALKLFPDRWITTRTRFYSIKIIDERIKQEEERNAQTAVIASV